MLTEKLFIEHEKIAQELADILQDILPLSLYPRIFSKKRLRKIEQSIAKFFFRYYLVLPQKVLEEINCLYACLRDGEHFYMIDRQCGIPTLRIRESEDEIISLLDEVAIVKRKKSMSEIYREYHKLPTYIIIICQARHVITVLAEEWNLKHLYTWPNRINKQTLAQIGKK